MSDASKQQRSSLLRGIIERFTPGVGKVKKSKRAVEKRGEVAGLSDVDGKGGESNDAMKRRDAMISNMIRKRRAARKAKF